MGFQTASEGQKEMILYKSISETEGNMSLGHKKLKIIFLSHYYKINLSLTVEKVNIN